MVCQEDSRRMSFMYRRGEAHESGTLTSAKILELSAELAPGDEVNLAYILKPLDTSKGERSYDVFSHHVIRAWKDHSDQIFQEHSPVARPEEALASATAASRAPSKGGVCKFWVNAASCPLGAACSLRHCSEEERSLARAEWLGRSATRRSSTCLTLYATNCGALSQSLPHRVSPSAMHAARTPHA
jgi:hypothetical protein